MINSMINQDATCLKAKQLNVSHIRYSINIPRELHYKFKEKSFLAGLDMKDVLLKAIVEYLNERKD